MPRLRGLRDERISLLEKSKVGQLSRLLLTNNLRITTSRLPPEGLEKALQNARAAQFNRIQMQQMRERLPSVRSLDDGHVVAVKDNFVTQDLPSTCASHILEGFSAEDATVVKLLKDAGLTVVAKTNMDEFGMGSHSTHSAYGPVGRSKEDSLSVGGSSGGSALAVASGLVDSALGSDTGGSVRLPAAYTGVVGFKPSYGMLSRKGLIPYANSLDTVGIFGKNVLDVWILYSILSHPDAQDPTCLSESTRDRIKRKRAERDRLDPSSSYRSYHIGYQHLRRPHVGPIPPSQDRSNYYRLRIGVPLEYNIRELHPAVHDAWVRTLSNLHQFGHEIVPISLPSTRQALSAYYILAPAEASSNLAKYDGVRYGKPRGPGFVDDSNGTLYSEYRGSYFGEEVQRRILLGSFSLSAGAMDNYFIQAQKVRRIVQSDFDSVFRMDNPLRSDTRSNSNGVDYIVCPTAPTPPPTHKELEKASPLDNYINDVFTVPASLAGLPAISVPAHEDEVKPNSADTSIGMQVIGQFGDDSGVLRFARRWMSGTGFRAQPKEAEIGGAPRLK